MTDEDAIPVGIIAMLVAAIAEGSVRSGTLDRLLATSR